MNIWHLHIYHIWECAAIQRFPFTSPLWLPINSNDCNTLSGERRCEMRKRRGKVQEKEVGEGLKMHTLYCLIIISTRYHKVGGTFQTILKQFWHFDFGVQRFCTHNWMNLISSSKDRPHCVRHFIPNSVKTTHPPMNYLLSQNSPPPHP